jgi:hypothetical protein
MFHFAPSVTPQRALLPKGVFVIVHVGAFTRLTLFTAEVFDFGYGVGNIRTSQSGSSQGKRRNMLSPSYLDAIFGRPET